MPGLVSGLHAPPQPGWLMGWMVIAVWLGMPFIHGLLPWALEEMTRRYPFNAGRCLPECPACVRRELARRW